MRGIILAGGSSTRMHPITSSITKHLLPIYDKPMIYYPLSILLLAGIADILIITRPDEANLFQKLLGDGSRFGVNIQYATQQSPQGIPQAFMIAEQFINRHPVCLVLGDNIIYGDDLPSILKQYVTQNQGATIFAHQVSDPENYGIVELDRYGNPISITEKPQFPKSNFAITGLYFYDNQVIEIAKQLKPSKRGELEISDVNNAYLTQNALTVKIFGRGIAWLDTGRPDGLLNAANFIHTLEARQGFKICCPEEIAWRMGLINDADLENISNQMVKCDYSKYLSQLLKERVC